MNNNYSVKNELFRCLDGVVEHRGGTVKMIYSATQMVVTTGFVVL
jgi:hypothetical protein